MPILVFVLIFSVTFVKLYLMPLRVEIRDEKKVVTDFSAISFIQEQSVLLKKDILVMITAFCNLIRASLEENVDTIYCGCLKLEKQNGYYAITQF